MENKIKAFTLMEVTITMLIAAVAISITYTAYRIVSHSYLDYKKKQDKMADIMVADKLLKKDFLSALRITRSDRGLVMEQAEGKINYVFFEDFMVRNQFALSTDTFKMTLKETSYWFENEEKDVGELLDEFDLSIQSEGQSIPLKYRKQYSSQDLFDNYASN